ncbi:MAG: nuclear transport factor 2 family protein, partial [Bacteroidales bacterium]|nr:nuclear transport factor 2 family protein [Bacteroidales bacterium]
FTNFNFIPMKIPTILLLCIVIFSCNQPSTKSTDSIQQSASVDVDSLTKMFLDGWNNHDSAAIVKTIADNAVVMNDSLIHTGINAIAQNWISGGVKVLSNIKTTSLTKGVSESVAYSGGTYSLDLTPPGGPVLKEKGNYSLVWSKQQNGDWKLTLVHIEDITRMPDIQ